MDASSFDSMDARRARVLRRVYDLSDLDLRVVEAILDELPVAALAERCEAETANGVDRVGQPAKVLPTGRRVIAQAILLRTIDAWRHVLGLPPRARRTVGSYLRDEQPAAASPSRGA